MASYLITGTSRGLGLTLAKFLAARPKDQVSLVITAARHKSSALEELIGKYPGRVLFVPLEVTSEASVNTAVKSVEEALGPSRGLDVLINNAGIMPFQVNGISQACDSLEVLPWVDYWTNRSSRTDLMQCLETNVNSVQLMTTAFLPLLRRGTQKTVLNM